MNEVMNEKQKRKLYNAAYYEKNKEKILQISKTYAEKNKEKVAKYKRDYISRNKERERLRHKNRWEYDKEFNPNKRKEYFREYSKTDKAKDSKKRFYEKYKKTEKYKTSCKNYVHKRRCKIDRGDVTTQQLLDLKIKYKNCYWCNCRLDDNNSHIDHYVPLSKGGRHTIGNLVMSCSKCNLKKSSKDPYAFAMSLGKLI